MARQRLPQQRECSHQHQGYLLLLVVHAQVYGACEAARHLPQGGKEAWEELEEWEQGFKESGQGFREAGRGRQGVREERCQRARSQGGGPISFEKDPNGTAPVERDEVHGFQDCWYISASEAIYPINNPRHAPCAPYSAAC